MGKHNRRLIGYFALWTFLTPLTGCGISGQIPENRTHFQPRYFASPREAVNRINELLRDRDWPTLSRYYDLTGTTVDRSELESGRLFLRTVAPPNADPAGLWRYRQPFPPGSLFDHEQASEASGVVSVVVRIEIDEGAGMIKRGLSVFKMKKSAAGYQLIPQ